MCDTSTVHTTDRNGNANEQALICLLLPERVLCQQEGHMWTGSGGYKDLNYRKLTRCQEQTSAWMYRAFLHIFQGCSVIHAACPFVTFSSHVCEDCAVVTWMNGRTVSCVLTIYFAA